MPSKLSELFFKRVREIMDALFCWLHKSPPSALRRSFRTARATIVVEHEKVSATTIVEINPSISLNLNSFGSSLYAINSMARSHMSLRLAVEGLDRYGR